MELEARNQYDPYINIYSFPMTSVDRSTTNMKYYNQFVQLARTVNFASSFPTKIVQILLFPP